MNAIKDAYINALLADSAYVTGFIGGMSSVSLKTILQQRMTPTQAQFIADHFSVVSTINTPDYFGENSGFDAVAWRGNSGTDYAEKLYISMRGTEGINDFLADIDLAVNTAASAQYGDMINWWLRISTPVGQMAPQVSRVGIGTAFVAAPPVAGTGEVAGVTHVQVNGHSLGGHLASAFARIFGNTLVIDGVSTFNSAGFIPNSEAVFSSLAQALGTGPTQFHSAAQTNYFARNGINVTTNSFYFNQIGRRQDIFNEQSGPLATHENHSMYKLTDTLALGNALSQIVPELSLETFNEILEAASATPGASLESLLDALRRLTTGDSPSPTPVGDAGDSAASRVAYHQNLLFWVDSAAFQALAQSGTTVHSLVDKTPAALALLAGTDSPEGIATRYALKELNPFAIVGVDYGNLHNQDGALDLYDPETGEGELPEQWIRDRAAMLAAAGVASIATAYDTSTDLNRAWRLSA